MVETKDRILDAAELLFARQGVDATSLRSVTQQAGVNGAAIHYHFGSKAGLVEALIRRRISPINAERIAKLERLEREAGAAPPALEALLEAFLAPVVANRSGLSGARGAPRLAGLFAWLHTEHDTDLAPIREQFEQVRHRFAAAVVRATPGIDMTAATEWLDFAMGAGLHLLAGARAAQRCEAAADVEARFERLLVFLVGAFEAGASRFAASATAGSAASAGSPKRTGESASAPKRDGAPRRAPGTSSAAATSNATAASRARREGART